MRRFLRRTLMGLVILSFLATAGTVTYLALTVDTEKDALLFNSSQGSKTTRLYYNTARKEKVYCAKEWESERLLLGADAIWYPYDKIGDNLKNAFIAAEDHRFYTHRGVDFLRTAKAAANQVLHFGGRFGGSTITQQLIKNLSGEDEGTITRKLRECWRALALERSFSKDEILELYLNIVPMGENCIGVSSGAERYFGKEVAELTLAECCTLAAIINAPARYDPVRHPEENKARRRLILGEMREYGMISDAEYATAYEEEVTILGQRDKAGDAPFSWYTETVIDDVLADLMRECGYSRAAALRLIYGGGLQIYTLVDTEVQAALEAAFAELALAEGVECAGVVVDPESGDILGVCGGRGRKSASRILNYATTPLPPGSALKPLSVYAPAIEEGLVNSATVFDDVPLAFSAEGTPWPRNFPDSYRGLCDLGTAIATSKNTVAVQVLRRIGLEHSYRILEEKLGFSHLVRGDKTGVSDLAEAPLALGQLSYGVTVRELTSAYTALAGDGTYRKGRTYLAVYDNKGKLLLENKPEATRAFSSTTASIMTKELESVVRVGTAKGVRLPYGIAVAGKTGTSSEGRDKWFVGYSPYYLAGIWCGSAKKTVAVAGKPQLAIFNSLMESLHRERSEDSITSFPLAPGVYERRFCRDGGGLLTLDCLCDPRGDRSTLGWFTADNIPSAACHTHRGVLCGESGGVLVPLGEHEADELLKKGPFRCYGLLHYEARDFPEQVYIEDAQYIYRFLGDTAPSEKETEAYFAPLLPAGHYAGISKTEDGIQFNATYRQDIENPFRRYEKYFSW